MSADKTIRIAVSEGTVGERKYQIIHGYGWNMTLWDEKLMFPDKPEKMPHSMIDDFHETYYKGFFLQRVPHKGWKIVLDDTEILFRYLIAAQKAIDAFYKTAVSKHQAEVISGPEEKTT